MFSKRLLFVSLKLKRFSEQFVECENKFFLWKLIQTQPTSQRTRSNTYYKMKLIEFDIHQINLMAKEEE